MDTLIPAFLRRERNQRRLTLEILSAKVGMSPQYLSEIERGKRDPRLSSIERMAEEMGMTDGEKKSLKRRQAIEPVIGHLKADHRMNRCHIKGSNWRQFACGPMRCRLQHPLGTYSPPLQG